jgi:hypothetical protein
MLMTQQTIDGTKSKSSVTETHQAKLRLFKVASVEKISPPDGGEGQDWYRYVLDSGRSMISGQRRGSRKDVQAYASQCAEQLNTRGQTGQSIWSPRGRKPAAATNR